MRELFPTRCFYVVERAYSGRFTWALLFRSNRSFEAFLKTLKKPVWLAEYPDLASSLSDES